MVNQLSSSIFLALAGASSVMASSCTPLTQLIVDSPDHTILEAIVTSADYDDILSALNGATEEAPLTVFAPNDAAFMALGLEFNPTNTTSENVDLVKGILAYHVIPGKLEAGILLSNYATLTLAEMDMIVKVDGGTVALGATPAAINTTDIAVCNGVVHIMDDVIIPPSSIAEIAASNTNTLYEILALPEYKPLLDIVTSGSKLTVFAPTDNAFTAAGVDVAFAKENVEAVSKIISYHVVVGPVYAGAIDSSAAPVMTTLTTANNLPLELSKSTDGSVSVEGVSVLTGDVLASNGVVHVIGSVLTPREGETSPPTSSAAKAVAGLGALVAATLASIF